MAKGSYAGVNNVAKKVKKVYVGVDGIARKVKKAYVGVNGIAKLCYSGAEKLARWGQLSNYVSRCRAAASTVGNYAIFLGGDDGNSPMTTVSTVQAFQSSFAMTMLDNLPSGITYVAATTVGNHALFYGGQHSETSRSSQCLAYDDNLVQSTLPQLDEDEISNVAATTLGNYAIFAGGYVENPYGGMPGSYKLQVVDTSLTHIVSGLEFDPETYNSAGTAVGNYAVFAGGNRGYNVFERVVWACNDQLVEISIEEGYIDIDKEEIAATTVGDYALFAFGTDTTIAEIGTIDIFTKDLVKLTPIVTSTYRRYVTATTLGKYAIFAGGMGLDPTYLDDVVVYDANLVEVEIEGLSIGRSYISSATVGDYAFFAGGRGASNTMNLIDIYTLE